MKNFVSKLLFAASLGATALFLTLPCHSTNAKHISEEEFPPREQSLSWSSSTEDPEFLIRPLSSKPSITPSDNTQGKQLLRLDLSVTTNAEHSEKEEDQRTRKLSSRLIMPNSNTTNTPTVEEEEDDLFEDMADEIEAALNRLSIARQERQRVYEGLPCEKELKPLNSSLATSSTLSLDSLSLLETEIALNPLRPELFQKSGDSLTVMIETAKDEKKSVELRVTYGRQAIMFLMTDNSFSRAFKGNKDLEIYELIVLLNSLNDPYATFRLAEYEFKSHSHEGSSKEKPSTPMEKANGTFTHALTLLLEQYDVEKDYVYLFNSMRTIVTETAIFSASLDGGFYSLLKAFTEKTELDESITKPQLVKELKKVLTFCESRFKSSQKYSS